MKLYGDLKKQTLYEQLYQSINRQFPRGNKSQTLAEWAEKTPIVLDGRPFSFQRHEYLRVPYQDNHPYQVEMKAAQMGLTIKAGLRSLHGCITGRYPRGVLHLFPNRSDVTDFSKGRIAPLIGDNEESIAKWIVETDSANLKQIGSSFLYLRGMQSRVGLKSVPADFVIFDELDESPPNAVDLAMERMSHSEIKEVLKLSNPSLPDFGIDKAFQETDQRYWHLKCPSCGAHTCLEETFPDCLIETMDGRVIRACSKCKAELNPSVGEWVAKHPSVTDKRGYHYSQLFSHFVNPAEILDQFRTTNNLTDFYNLKIGVPHVEATNRLTVEEILSLCGSEGIASQDPGPCSMGVDQGKDLHVVVGKKHPEKAGKIVFLGVLKEWEELDALMRNFSVDRCVVDGLPETRNARAFAERHRSKIFLNYYSESQKGAYKWDEANLTVNCNRTESLDASHNEILSGQIILPRESDLVRQFAEHLHNTAKRLEEDEESGSKRYVYVKLGADHFRHAFNYESMAREGRVNRTTGIIDFYREGLPCVPKGQTPIEFSWRNFYDDARARLRENRERKITMQNRNWNKNIPIVASTGERPQIDENGCISVSRAAVQELKFLGFIEM